MNFENDLNEQIRTSFTIRSFEPKFKNKTCNDQPNIKLVQNQFRKQTDDNISLFQKNSSINLETIELRQKSESPYKRWADKFLLQCQTQPETFQQFTLIQRQEHPKKSQKQFKINLLNEQ